jgi:outer membrane protein TolC
MLKNLVCAWGAFSISLGCNALATPAQAQEAFAPGAPRHLTLREALDLAMDENPQVRVAMAGLEASRASVRASKGAFLPTLSVSSSYARSSSQRFDQATQRNVTGTSRDSYATGISTSLDLFNGGRRLADLRSARAGHEAASHALTDQRLGVSLAVKQAFYAAVSARELVKVDEERVRRAEAQLRFSAEKVRYGTATRSDSLRGVLELRNAEMSLTEARRNESFSQVRLAEIIGLSDPVVPSETESLAPRFLEVGSEPLLEEVVNRSPSVMEARAQMEAATASLSASRSAYFPTLRASYSSNWSGDRFLNDERGRARSWSLRVGLSYPIFDGLRREDSIARSAASLASARSRLRESRLAVLSEMTEALGDLETARFAIVSGEQAVAVAEEDLRVQQERYGEGVSTLLDLLSSQVALDEARVNLIRSQFDYRVAIARIEALLGRPLQEDQ